MDNASPRAAWSGQLAFVLAAAASAIGLGNLWRFPYLAARYGGGLFLLVYCLLVFTLGFTLMITEIAIGRKTRQSQLTAYDRLRPHAALKTLGVVATVIPMLITPYYCVIGGWVLHYLKAYAVMAFTGVDAIASCPPIAHAAGGLAAAAGSDAFFHSFVGADFAPFGHATLFILACAVVILLGVKNGIERANLVMMPILFLMALALCVYVVCLPDSGDGLRYYLVPNLDGLRDAAGRFSPARLGKTILGAMGQMFYSLSLSMGIMVTYGSYMRRSDSIEKCARRVGFFDTLFAGISGLMVVPVVYLFAVKTGVTPELLAQCGGDAAAAAELAVKNAMNTGPGLMFITLPKVFATLGAAGAWVGLAFFVLVTFAAATSAISLYEACVASVCDVLRVTRRSATFFTTALLLFLAVFSALGYGPWRAITLFGMQFLDFFDFVTNSALMPLTAAATCVFVGWFLGPEAIVAEVEAQGRRFGWKRFYVAMAKYLAPAFVTAILVSEISRALGLGGWSI